MAFSSRIILPFILSTQVLVVGSIPTTYIRSEQVDASIIGNSADNLLQGKAGIDNIDGGGDDL